MKIKRKDKTSINVRNEILAMLESGNYAVGDKLPGGRELAETLGTSLLTVQSELSSLAATGLLQLVPNSGTYVSVNWHERLLKYTVRSNYNNFEWMPEYRKMLHDISPEFYPSGSFRRAMIEIQGIVQSHRNFQNYQDLTPCLDCLNADDRRAVEKLAKPFTFNGQILGIPLSASPRLFFYNTRIARQYNIKIPHGSWQWPEFLEMLNKLPADMPGEDKFHYGTSLNLISNVVLRSGGCFFDPSDPADPVKLDHPDTIKGMKSWYDLKQHLKVPPANEGDFRKFLDRFIADKAAFFIGNRINIEYFKAAGFDHYDVIDLPELKPGCNYSAPAMEVLRIRRECPADIAARFVHLALSTNYQNFFYKHHYGFPVVPSAYRYHQKITDRRDMLFFENRANIRADYIDGFPGLLSITRKLVEELFSRDGDFVENLLEVADILRRLIRLNFGNIDANEFEY